MLINYLITSSGATCDYTKKLEV